MPVHKIFTANQVENSCLRSTTWNLYIKANGCALFVLDFALKRCSVVRNLSFVYVVKPQNITNSHMLQKRFVMQVVNARTTVCFLNKILPLVPDIMVRSLLAVNYRLSRRSVTRIIYVKFAT